MESSTHVAAAPELAPSPSPPQRRKGSVRSFFEEMGDLTVFAFEAIRALPGVPRFASEALRQAAILVRGSTFLVAAMTVFMGFTVSTFAYFFLRAAGASDYLGVFTGLTTPRASTPVMFGYVFAAKVGCGLVAEIGSMKINEEVDALETEGVSPLVYVVGTRLVGAIIFVPIAVGAALLASSAGNWFNAIVVLDALDSATFLNNHWGSQNIGDQVLAFVSLGTMAMGVVIVSCFYGYRARGGPAGVGTAVARSLVINLVLVHIVAAFYISLFYGTDPHLPIGG